jgi:nucleotide-binding universal stress UspA family protein
MKTILVPLDSSARDARILPYACALARISGARLHLLHIISDEETEMLIAADAGVLHEAGAVRAPAQERDRYVRDMLRQHTEDHLEELAVQLRNDGLEVAIETNSGVPAESIVETAARQRADLIAIATHGYTGLRRWTLGSVTDKIIHMTKTPVFVVPGGCAMPACEPRLRRIMLTLDGSAFAGRALPLAVDWATSSGAELLLFQAVAPTTEVYHGSQLPEGIQVALREQAHEELRVIAGELRRCKFPISIKVASGYPADKIVEAAACHQADVIVMATHGYSGFKRWALGSVADKVLHASTTPLVLVH